MRKANAHSPRLRAGAGKGTVDGLLEMDLFIRFPRHSECVRVLFLILALSHLLELRRSNANTQKSEMKKIQTHSAREGVR